MVLFNRSKVQETSFQTLGFLSLYNGKPLKHLQNTKIVKKSYGNRLKLLQMAGEEHSRRMKTTNGGDLRRRGEKESGEMNKSE